jgi:hypothetical protein
MKWKVRVEKNKIASLIVDDVEVFILEELINIYFPPEEEEIRKFLTNHLTTVTHNSRTGVIEYSTFLFTISNLCFQQNIEKISDTLENVKNVIETEYKEYLQELEYRELDGIYCLKDGKLIYEK